MLLRELLAGVDVVAVHAPLDMEIPPCAIPRGT